MSDRMARICGGLMIGLGALSALGCAEAVTTDDGLESDAPGADAAIAADGATHHAPDSGAAHDSGPAPAIDSLAATDSGGAMDGPIDAPIDGAVAADAAAPIDSGVGAVDCPSNGGKYTIEYLAATALAGEGGAPLPSCPCASGTCCYTPPGGLGAAVCLPL